MDSQAAYEFTRKGFGHLTIDTNAAHGGASLMTPPESASSHRRHSYDVNLQQTPMSMYHPNTPVFAGGNPNSYDVGPNDMLKMSFQGLDNDAKFLPSSVDFTSGQQSYVPTACNSPSWPLSIAFEQKSAVGGNFYQDSATLLSNDQDWNTSTLGYSSVDYHHQDPNQLFTLPSEDPSSSFFSEADSSHHEQLPGFIAPSQAVHQPEVDYNMTGCGWNTDTPVHDGNILHSSSPTEFSPVTPSTYDYSFDAAIKSESSPPSSVYIPSATRSCLSKKGRKTSKLNRRHTTGNTYQDVHFNGTGTVDLVVSEPAARFKRLQREGKKPSTDTKGHRCPLCEQRFARSEHCKRHMQSHTDEYPYLCYWSGPTKDDCRVGKKGNGSQNRRDNSHSHLWTHLKPWCVEHSPIAKERNRLCNKKSKGRNHPVSPTEMLLRVRGRVTDTVQRQDQILDFLNKEAGKDLDVHILWDVDGCPIVPCVGRAGLEGGCTMCRTKTNKKKA